MRTWKPEKQSAWIRKKFGLNILGKNIIMEEEKKQEEKVEDEGEEDLEVDEE